MVTFESEQDHCYWYIGGGTGVKEQRSMDAVIIAQPLHESVSWTKNNFPGAGYWQECTQKDLFFK